MVVHVVAGILYDQRGRVLIAQRPAGKALAGRWEFPGGKVGEGEAPYDALVRELREELALEVAAATRLMEYPVTYPDCTIRLDVWIVSEWTGTARGLDGQAFKWVPLRNLASHDILEADAPIIEALRRRHAGVGGAAGADGPG